MPQTSTCNNHIDNDSVKSIPVISCQVMHLFEMFWPVIDIINLGKETWQMSADNKRSFCAQLPQDQKQLFFVLERLLDKDSTLIERVARAPCEHITALTRDLKKSLSNGQSNSQSEDMGKVIQEIPGWEVMDWDPLLLVKSKHGMFHTQCAKLLAPMQLDWTNPKVCDDFRKGKLIATPLQFPQHLWSNCGENYNPQQPLDGFLQGKNLTCAAFSILFSPGSVKAISASTTQASVTRGCSFKRLRGGVTRIAMVYNLSKVTPAFLAYVAVAVHHTLTTKAIFSEIRGKFNYGVYYNQICMFLEAPRFASCVRVLLDWWNRQLFGLYNMGEHILDKDGVAMLDELDAEVEANLGLLGDEEPRFGGQSSNDSKPEDS